MSGRPNRYSGACRNCGADVPAGAGTIAKVDGRWQVEHHACPVGSSSPARPARPAAASFAPTSEQEAALELFASGESMVIEAGAGTGKTSTLRLLGESTRKRGLYAAFNKAIVADVKGSFPANVTASTVHSLAYRTVGKRYQGRMGKGRMRPNEIARRLDVEPFFLTVANTRKTLSADFLAGVVMKAASRFCQTADEAPGRSHFPLLQGIEEQRDDGLRSYANNDAVRAHLAPALERAWADLRRVDGALPFNHGHYLKLWQLEHPRLETDFILFDEAQDASPVMAAVVAEQAHAQRVYVGDAQQAIYEFTGAVNSIAAQRELGFPVRMLSQSFRFGPAIAEAANLILDKLDADLRLSGLPSIASTVGALEGDPDAILCRTNAMAVDRILDAKERDVVAHLVGGGSEIVQFSKGARELQQTGHSSHADLACFVSWDEVVAYVENDQLGDELALNVKLIEKYGIPTILSALEHMPSEADSTLIVSTVHKAKGREWDRVALAGDFMRQNVGPDDDSDGELRLQYVASTRAKLHLDNTVFDKKEKADDPAPAAV